MWDLAIICHHSFEFLFTLNKCRDMGTPAWYASWAPSLIQTPLAQTVKTWIFYRKKLLIKAHGPLSPLRLVIYSQIRVGIVVSNLQYRILLSKLVNIAVGNFEIESKF